jgi:hypothetical protein
MAKYKIGPFEFINLTRLPSFPTTHLTREVRPGADGVTLWKHGKTAEPLVVESVVDVATMADAIALLRSYETIVGTAPVDLVFADNTLPGVQAVVGGVMPLEGGVHAMVIGIGGTKGSSAAMVRAAWLLHIISAQQ